jgi:phage protein D
VAEPQDPDRKRTLPQYRIKINGADAPADLVGAVSRLVIDERLHLPTMFEIHLVLDRHNPRWVDDGTIAEGKEVELLLGYVSEEQSICVGKVTSLDVDLDDHEWVIEIRGFDLSFALHRDVKSRSFLKQTDSDIAQKIAGEGGGLTSKIDATSEVHEYILQHAQTNYEFLLDRARRNGYELRVVGKELRFQKPSPNGSPFKLTMGVNLKRFSPRLSVAEQVDKVEVRGWDVKAKEAIVATADKGESAPKIGESKTASAIAKDVWGSATKLIPDAPVDSLGEARTLAQAVLDDHWSSFVQATAECHGDPKLRVGTAIEVEGVGKRFGGTYYLTAVRHVISKDGGYNAFLTASTRKAETVSSLLMDQEKRAIAPHVVTGIVTNNKEEENNLARVKVKFPWLFDQDESYWARLVTPMAGNERGYLTFPEVNDEVLVAFEHGDPNRPFVLGALWNGKDVPPKGTADLVGGDGKVNQRIWRSRTGHLFIFDDTDGKESIQIIDKTEKNHIIITSDNNKLDVYLEGDIDVTSKTGKITVLAEKDISLESKSGKIKLKGVDTEFEATQSAKMKSGTSFDVDAGTSFAAKAKSSAELSGTASVKIEGGTADVQGKSVTNVKGGIVNIN